MSFFIPLPRNSTRVYREFLKALEQEFVIQPGYQQANAHHLAMVWASYMDAARLYAEQADKGGTNDHQLARTRAVRRVLNIWATRFSHEREKVTAILRRRDALPVDTGKALALARGGTRGNSGSATRLHDVYTRMQRDKQQQ